MDLSPLLAPLREALNTGSLLTEISTVGVAGTTMKGETSHSDTLLN